MKDMKKTTSQKFSKRLAQYGALSAAIASMTGLNAQELIGYTDIPDYSGTPDPYYIIDFDGDATNDFVIYSTTYGLYGYVYGVNKVLGSVYSFISSYSSSNIGLIYPFALNNDAIISGGQNSWINQYYDFDYGWNILNVNSCGYGVWCDVTNKYIGIQFKIGPNTHYGWARLDVGMNGNVWTLKDYAYHMTPNTQIRAGQTTSLGIDDNVFSKIKVIALKKSIGLYNLPEETTYNVLNMTGQLVLNGNTQNRNHVIEAPTLTSGVYIVELADTNSNGVIRKKIVLQ
ncbi:T9SS type A sorting domain-containing protein [Flavobacteriaceae bacterium LMO-SS05]